MKQILSGQLEGIPEDVIEAYNECYEWAWSELQ